MSHKYGSSNNPEYLENQIEAIDDYVSEMAGDMSYYEILERYEDVDELTTRYNSLTDLNHADNVAEWKSRQCGEW